MTFSDMATASREPAGRASGHDRESSPAGPEPCGVTVIDKPGGVTSHDVVNRVRRHFGVKRVGHAGTLDPMATGVLVVCVGSATRIIEYLPTEPKVYEAAVTFGMRTDTQDVTGNVLDRNDASRLEARSVEAALAEFVGPIMQTPPMVSALQIGGKRLYALARQGTTVERTPRPITVHRLCLRDFVTGSHPVARISVECSAGTYVRTLAADIGDRLGCGAVLSELRRTRVGAFGIHEAQSLDAVPDLMPIERALSHLPFAEIADGAWADMLSGRSIDCPSAMERSANGPTSSPDAAPDGPIALVRRDGEGYAVVRIEGGRLHPIKVMPLRRSRS